MKIGIICASDIAKRRFMPSLNQIESIEFVGIAVNSPEERFEKVFPEKEVIDGVIETSRKKAQIFADMYGGKIFDSYEEIINSDEIEAIYIPLPPSLHYKCAKKALMAGKHVLLEKPFTIELEETEELINIAREKNLALHENYMFTFHSQIEDINNIVFSGEIGDIRLYRICFGFPMRAVNDFRYNKSLGGGALIDAGGYTIKYASLLLNDTIKVSSA